MTEYNFDYDLLCMREDLWLFNSTNKTGCNEYIDDGNSAKFQENSLNKLIHQALSSSLEKSSNKLKNNNLLFSIVLSDDSHVHQLNFDYRGKDKPTNILSFAALDGDTSYLSLLPPDEPVIMGDMIIAYETLKKEAFEQKKPFKNHFYHLLVHSTLHLLGYDHIDDHDAEVMETLERQILAADGYPDPYQYRTIQSI